jgi:hypothetical protein
MGSRLTWPSICNNEQFRGRWVALDDCRYDERTAEPLEGSVIDCDEDLVELCSRMQASDSRRCAILFCGSDEEPPPSTRRARNSFH